MSVQSVTAYQRRPSQILGLGAETTTGTAANPSALLYFRGDFGLRASEPDIDSEQMTGRMDPIDPLTDQQTVEGDLEFLTDTTAFAFWLAAMFGAPSVGVYSMPTTLPSVTLYRYLEDITEYATYKGVHVRRWSISAAADKYIVSRLSLVGRNETWSTSAPSGSPTETPPVLPFTRGGVTVAIATLDETPVAVTTPVTGVSLDFDFGLAADSVPLGAGDYRTLWLPGMRVFTGNIRALIPDRVLIDGAIAKTPYSLTITFTAGATSLELAFPRVIFERPTIVAEGAVGLLTDLPFRATRPESGDTYFTATVA